MNASTATDSLIDLPLKDLERYRISRAIAGFGYYAPGHPKRGSLEREVSDEIARKLKRATGGIFIPTGIPFAVEGYRAASGTAYGATINSGQGGASLVATNVLAGSFIDALRNKARVVQMGATMLPGLVGNAAIPRQSTASTATWISPEGADAAESEGVFDSVSMTPKTISTRSQYTRNLLLQSTPAVEMLVRNDLAKTLALGIDLAAITGTGASGQPTGILNTSGVASIALGANGAACTIDNLIDMETAITSANADEDSISYLTNTKVIGAWKKLKDTTGRYLWTQYPGVSGQRSPTPGEINGYPAYRTNQVPSNLTKGSGTGLSAIILGNWSDLIIGEWGVLEILPNPYGAGYNSGSIDIRAMQSVDIKVRHAASFAAITDAIA